MNRSRISLIVLLMLFVVQSVFAFADFAHTPIGPFTIEQNETFVYDFNATYTSNGSAIPEDGSVVRFDYSSDDASEIDAASSFSFSTITGLFNYTPSNNDATKNFTILFLLREPGDAGSVLDSVQPAFNITNINDPPEITSFTPASPIGATENDTINLTINATDPDGPYGEVLNATWTIERPINTTYTETTQLIAIPGQGVLNYTIGFCDAGVLTINGTAIDDEGLNDSISWTVNVADLNRNVTFNSTTNITNQTFNESEGLVANFTYDEFFQDPDDLICADETLTFTLDGAVNTNLTINQSSGVVVFNATPFWSGNETVTITATDAGGSNVTSNNFTIFVVAVEDDPIGIEPGPQTGYQDIAFEMFVRFEDPDLPYGDALTYDLNSTTIGTNTLNLTWYNQSGNASYAWIRVTPSVADLGTYAYRLTANDSTDRRANVTFTITIEANEAPQITEPVILSDATQDEPYLALINGTEEDGEPISWFIDILASNGSLSPESFGTYNATVDAYALVSGNDTQANLSFTPENDDVGNYTLIIYALDTRGARTNATTHLTILNVNDPPENLRPTGITLKAKTGTPWNYTATVEDPDMRFGDFVNITVNDSAITITNTTTNGSRWFMEWEPMAPDIGNRSIELNATDTNGSSIVTTFTIEVLAAAGPKILTPTNLVAQVGIEYTNLIQASDPNGDPIIFTYNESIWNNSNTPVGDNASFINVTPGFPFNYSINITAYDPIDDLSDSVVVTFSVEPFNLAPYLLDARNLSFVSNETRVYNFTVDDAEDNLWNAFFLEDSFDWVTVTRINQTHLQLSGTPNESHIGLRQGNLVINQTDYPPRNTTYLMNLSVFSDPQSPEITAREPTFNNDPSIANEGTSRTFSVTVIDPNFPGPGTNESDRVSIAWIFNGETVQNRTYNETITDEYAFEYDYCTAPGGTLEVIVTDLTDLTDTTEWSVDIANVNRAPYFGEKRFSYDVISNEDDLSYATGEWTLTNIIDTGTSLEQENTSVVGTIVSPVLDLGRENSINKANITNLTILGVEPVYYEVRFNSIPPGSPSSTASWTNWSNITAVGTAPANITIRKYLQIRFTLNSTDPIALSSITNATLHYDFANRTINSSSTYLDYYFLDDYFTDLDFEECTDESVNATVVDSAPELVMEIDQESRSVDIITDTSFGYIHPTEFVYTDSHGANATSNLYTIEVVERPDQLNEPQPTSGGGGGGGSSTIVVTEPEPVEVPDPVPLDIITPGSITMYENDTLSIPVSIVNRWNESLENILITAESENDNTTLELELERITSLPSGANETFNLTITSYATYGEYAVRVFATVEEPEFNTSSTILISSIELGGQGAETFNTKLTFTRDIVESNPRCLELNEQIEQARELLTGGATSEAAMLLDDVVENCRFLISLDDATLDPDERSLLDRLMSETSTETKVYAGVVILVNIMLFGLVAMYLFRMRKPKIPAEPRTS